MSQPAPAPVPPTVQDILANSPVGPLLHRPVDQVLAGLGIPPLPQLPPLPPLPGLPPVPALDPVALLKPITDSFGHLGSGSLASMGSLDPTQVLSEVASGLTSVISLGTTAIGLLSSLQGAGAQQAATKSTEAQANTAAVSDQAAGMSALVATAAAVVQVGNAELAAIAAKLAAELTVAAAVPGGAPFGAAAAAESSVEAAAVIAHVKAELGVLAAQMTAVGQPVPITSAPDPTGAGSSTAQTAGNTAATTAKTAATTARTAATTATSATDAATTAGTGLGQAANAVQSAAQPVSQLAQFAQPVSQFAQQLAAAPAESLLTAPRPSATPLGLSAEMVSATGGLGGGFATAGVISEVGASALGEPLQETVLAAPVEQSPAVAAAHASATTATATDYTPAVSADRATSPMMPMGGPGMLGGRAGAADSETRGSAVHAQHGDAVVGQLDGLVTPVVGVAAHGLEPTDKELTL